MTNFSVGCTVFRMVNGQKLNHQWPTSLRGDNLSLLRLVTQFIFWVDQIKLMQVRFKDRGPYKNNFNCLADCYFNYHKFVVCLLRMHFGIISAKISIHKYLSLFTFVVGYDAISEKARQ